MIAMKMIRHFDKQDPLYYQNNNRDLLLLLLENNNNFDKI